MFERKKKKSDCETLRELKTLKDGAGSAAVRDDADVRHDRVPLDQLQQKGGARGGSVHRPWENL